MQRVRIVLLCSQGSSRSADEEVALTETKPQRGDAVEAHRQSSGVLQQAVIATEQTERRHVSVHGRYRGVKRAAYVPRRAQRPNRKQRDRGGGPQREPDGAQRHQSRTERLLLL